MLFVENCTLKVDRFCGDSAFCVFCYPIKKDDFDVIGDFDTKEEAESFLQFMQKTGGKISAFRKIAEDWKRQ